MNNQQQNLQPNPQTPPSQEGFNPLHACNVTNPQQAAPSYAQLTAICTDLYNRLLLLQSQALPGSAQAPAGLQPVSHNSNIGALAAPQQGQQDACPPANPALEQLFGQIEAEQPGFFAQNPVRSELKNYICQNCGHLHTDEINRILDLAKGLETQAVEGFKAAQAQGQGGELSDVTRQKLAQDANRLAINKLAVNSAAPKYSGSVPARIFTRQQIAGMSAKEFKENQPEIFAQYRKGMIK